MSATPAIETSETRYAELLSYAAAIEAEGRRIDLAEIGDMLAEAGWTDSEIDTACARYAIARDAEEN